jgi:hypothetical protein
MFDPLAMIIADHATRQHVLSARPEAPERPPRERSHAMRRLVVTALRGLADRLEPRRAGACVPAP